MRKELVCVAFDPGVVKFAHVVVVDTREGMPLVSTRRTQRLIGPPGDAAYAAAQLAMDLQALDLENGPDAEFICAYESFKHRGYVVRRIASAPSMGAVVAGIRLAARNLDWPVVEVDPEEHRNMIARALFPPGLRNQHERDAYTVALVAIAKHRLGVSA